MTMAHRRADPELERDDWPLTQFLEGLPVGVFVVDHLGHPIYTNRLAEEVLGQGAVPEASVKDFPKVYNAYIAGTEDELPPDRQPIQRALRGESGAVEEIDIHRPDRIVSIEVWANPIRGPHGDIRYAIAAFSDITARRTAEEALRLSEERLQQAQKMEAIGLLAGGIAHDFNNLLTAIMGFSDLLADQIPEDSPLQVFSREIVNAGERASHLTRQLLAFSRKQVLQPEVLDLNEIILEMGKLLRRVIGENIQLRTSPGPGLVPVRVDRGQMEQILMNLAVNARDAMATGGKLTIETSNVDLDDSYFQSHGVRQVGIKEPGQYVMLAVSDSGCGMDRETLERIFEPFFTTKALGQGTGLGLSTVYGIVKQSGGDIWVYSEPGHGTTFKIYLPVHDHLETQPPTVKSTAVGGDETILLVEDELGVRSLARSVLEGRGYRVLEAATAEEAMTVADLHSDIAVLVTDLMLPGQTGRQLAEALGPRFPTLKVLYVSGYTDDVALQNGLLEAPSAYLQKPFTPTSLSRKVREVLDDQQTDAPEQRTQPRSPKAQRQLRKR